MNDNGDDLRIVVVVVVLAICRFQVSVVPVAGGMMMGRASSMTSIAKEYAQLVGGSATTDDRMITRSTLLEKFCPCSDTSLSISGSGGWQQLAAAMMWNPTSTHHSVDLQDKEEG